MVVFCLHGKIPMYVRVLNIRVLEHVSFQSISFWGMCPIPLMGMSSSIYFIFKKEYIIIFGYVTTKTTKLSRYVLKAIRVLKTEMLVHYIRYMYVNISGLDVYMVCICPKK